MIDVKNRHVPHHGNHRTNPLRTDHRHKWGLITLKYLVGVFLILHGLVHLWYVVLSRGLVEFQPEMGWTGRSWLLSHALGDATVSWLASGLYVLATVGFVLGGVGYLAGLGWWPTVVMGSVAVSTIVIALFWDGMLGMIVPKGLIGVAINVAILLVLALARSADGG